MGPFLSELRYTLRRIGKARFFSLAVVLMLAFGIGACTAIFSLIQGILLRPLPFPDSGSLVQLGEHVGENPGIGVTARDIQTYSSSATAFQSVGGFATTDFELSGNATPEYLSAARLNASIFPSLGVQPTLGRVFSAQEEDSRATVAVLCYALWTGRYHRAPNVLGQTIQLNRKVYTIIGVMPRGFEFPLQRGHLDQIQLWVPLSLTPEELSDPNAGIFSYQMIARLKPGVTTQQAAQDAARVAQIIMQNYPATMSRIHIRGDVKLLGEAVTGEARPLLRVLFFAAAVVLLIACVNVAILMLVRAIRNQRDQAVRLALGARSGIILRETLLEGLLLSLTGGLLGLAGAALVLPTVTRLLPDSLPRLDAISIDSTVAAFALAATLLTGIVCSLALALLALRTNLVTALKEGLGTASSSGRRVSIRSILASAEIAIALLLLTASAMALRSYQKMLAIDPGFRPEHVLSAFYRLPITQYPTNLSVDTFNRQLIDRLSSKPGVISVGIADSLPSAGNSAMSAYTLEGERTEAWKLKFAAFAAVDGDYFQALGIPLIAGRTFTSNDGPNAPQVIILSQSMAQHSWPGQNAIGKRMHVGNPKKGLPWATVVGIVGNTRIGARDEKPNDQWYLPVRQPAILYGPSTTDARAVALASYIILRAAIPPDQMPGILRAAVAEVDPLLALDDIQPMSDVIATTEAPRRVMTELVGGFALAALLLSITGIYAVISFAVSMRTHEIAIRMALGAPRSSIAQLILQSGLILALYGCGAGVLISLALAKFVQSFLFEVTATDPLIYLAGAALMILVATLASLLPALRAAKADPVRILRSA
jgi:putative ABC transport system permease protein